MNATKVITAALNNARDADKAPDDYCAFHDIHVTHVDAIVPRKA